MIELSKKIELNKSALEAANLTSRFDEDDLVTIGNHVLDGYKADEQSRSAWRRRNEEGMNLALQIVDGKSFPWPNCSNVKFPLITIAGLQFHARAYPAIIDGTEIVKYIHVGKDDTGLETERADRVGHFMSWQLLEQDQTWEEQEDKSLLIQSIAGCTFKKSYHNSMKSHNVSDLVLARDLVMNYYAKSVNECPRKTHIIPMFRNDIYEKVKRGTYRNCLEEAWYLTYAVPQTSAETAAKDKRQGLTAPESDDTTPFTMLEQHLDLDLDGDGYAEPYIITVEESTGFVLRIVTRFDREEDIERVGTGERKGDIVKINATEFFTKRPFIPNPDGGIYDIGFGVLIGPLNESVNTLINQLIDRGTLNNMGGGFIARGAKIRGGTYQFAMNQYHTVESTGNDLKSNIVPFPTSEPSPVLFQLLGLLVDYANRIASTTETNVGENPGQNTPKYNMQVMEEMGAKVYTAIFKRIWRSFKEEYKKLYKLNGIYLPIYTSGPEGLKVTAADFKGNPDNIRPVADPHLVSERSQQEQAIMLDQLAMTHPGFDRDLVTKRVLKAFRVDGIDQIFPGSQKTGPLPNPKVQVEQMKMQFQQAKLQQDKLEFVAQLQEDMKKNQAEIIKIHAETAEIMAGIQSVETGHKIALMELQLGMLKEHNLKAKNSIDQILKGMELENDAKQAEAKANSGGVDSSGGAAKSTGGGAS